MPCSYLNSEQDDFNKIPELQVIAEALYDAESVLSNPSAFKAEEIRTLRDQIVSDIERAWEIRRSYRPGVFPVPPLPTPKTRPLSRA
jgi:hypothetical protein